jgi:predicted flap endonuclease-1-like 5' DNA nuclease
MVQSQDVIDMPKTESPGESPREFPNVPGGQTPGETARRTLALRIAQRNRLRAERLARLRAGARVRPTVPEPSPAAATDPEPETSAPETTAAVPDLPETKPEPEIALEAVPKTESVTATAPDAAEDVTADTADELADEVAEASAALEEFLQALSDVAGPAPEMTEPAAVLRFQRPAGPSEPIGSLPGSPATARRAKGDAEPIAAPICDLHLLHGAGPGLIWALQRAGIACLAEMAPLAPDALADRLGLLGPLVPAERWIAAARDRVGGG